MLILRTITLINHMIVFRGEEDPEFTQPYLIIIFTVINSRGFADSILECKDCDARTRLHPECLPISVPKGDPFYPQINITSGKNV